MKFATQVLQGACRFKLYSILFFAVVCGCVLLSGPAAMAADQCTNPTVGAGTGGAVENDAAGACAVVITVFAVDGTGKAIGFNATNTGVGAYDSIEDVLVGVQNNTSSTLFSLPLTSSSQAIFGFDADGPCNVPHAGNFTWCPGTTGYEGPVNTFTVTNGTSGTVNFPNGIPANGSTWFALEGGPDSLALQPQTVQQALTNGSNTFNFSTGTATTRQTVDYTNACGPNGCSNSPSGAASTTTTTASFNGITMQVTLTPISDAQFNSVVKGTFADGSSCIKQDFGGGNLSCAATTVLCATTQPPQPGDFAGTNCPQGTSGLIGLIAKYSAPEFNLPSDVHNPAYLAGTDDALTCTTHTASCPQLYNAFTNIQNDCCTTNGGTKSFNSTFFVAQNLPVWYQPPGTMCDGDAGHAILQPVNADGTSVYKQGRTIPLKFRVCDVNGVSVGTAGVVTNFELVQRISGTVTTVLDSLIDTNLPDSGFRFDPTAQQWIFNLSTSNLSAGTTYQYRISLNDGTRIEFQFGLR